MSYQIENNIFYKSPTFVTDKNLFTLCFFWDFDFSLVKRYTVALKTQISNLLNMVHIYLVKHGILIGSVGGGQVYYTAWVAQYSIMP